MALPVILGSQNATSAVNGATTEPRIRINRPDDEIARCRVSRVRDQPKNFSQPTQPLTTLSTSNAISPPQKRTEPSGPRRCRRGATSSLRREPDMPADLLRALFGNVTVPERGIEVQNIVQSTRKTFGVPSQGVLIESSDKIVRLSEARYACQTRLWELEQQFEVKAAKVCEEYLAAVLEIHASAANGNQHAHHS